jgi:MFS family permease
MTTNHPVVVAGLIFILGGILQTACQNRETMLAGRFFAGVGIGFLGVLAPCESTESLDHPRKMLIYQYTNLKSVRQMFPALSERSTNCIAHPSNRGRLTATFQLFIGIGAFVAGWIGYGCSRGAPGTQVEWRVPVGHLRLIVRHH